MILPRQVLSRLSPMHVTATSPTRHSTYDTLPLAPTSPKLTDPLRSRSRAPQYSPTTPHALPSLTLSSLLAHSLSLASYITLFLPWCTSVGGTIVLPRAAGTHVCRAMAHTTSPPRAPWAHRWRPCWDIPRWCQPRSGGLALMATSCCVHGCACRACSGRLAWLWGAREGEREVGWRRWK